MSSSSTKSAARKLDFDNIAEYIPTRAHIRAPKELLHIKDIPKGVELIPDPLPATPCKTPRFGPGQDTLSESVIWNSTHFGYLHVRLDDGPSELLIVPDILSSIDRSDYLTEALKVERQQGKTIYGHAKPRKEVFYSPSGSPYRYSGRDHPTVKYPEHVSKAIFKIMTNLDQRLAVDDCIDFTKFKVSITGDIMYDSDIPQGGSCGAHSDDEMKWPLIIIYSAGQTRWLRFRNKQTGKYTNVEMVDNSIVIMYGDWFQEQYTHQVDRLALGEPVGTRHSLNIRFERDDDY